MKIIYFNLGFLLFIGALILSSCECECKMDECRINALGKPITIYSNVSGGQGTHITPDTIWKVLNTSATVNLTIKRIGRCHKVLGFGHVWSRQEVPLLDFDKFTDFGSINAEDFKEDIKIGSILMDLTPKTNYYVRSWVAVDVSNVDCTVERTVYYNDVILKFTTL